VKYWLYTLNKAIEEQSTRFFCKIYQGKHKGSVLLANEQHTEQPEQTHILPMVKCTGKKWLEKITLAFE